ncbi:hypothetical protein LguiB_011607 [Lonicera macranthoides]
MEIGFKGVSIVWGSAMFTSKIERFMVERHVFDDISLWFNLKLWKEGEREEVVTNFILLLSLYYVKESFIILLIRSSWSPLSLWIK